MTDYVELPSNALLDHENIPGAQGGDQLPGEQVDEQGNHYQLRPDGTKRLIVDIYGSDAHDTTDPSGKGPDTGYQDLPQDAQLDHDAPAATLGREAGVAARGAGEGLADIGDLGFSILPGGKILQDINSSLGGPTGKELLTKFANFIGLPDAESAAEHYLKAGASGVASGLATGGIAPEIGLISSALGGAGSALGGEAARQSGAGPIGQLAASVAGGLPAAAAPSLASIVQRAVTEALQPLTASGAANRAASILQNGATNVESAAANIANRAEPVAGSQPTLAEVAGDQGLAGIQRGQGNTSLNASAALAERNANNALARTGAASEALGSGSPQAIQQFGQVRTGVALTQAEQANAARIKGAQSGLSSAVEGIGTTADRESTGAAARQQFYDAYDAAKVRTREAYSAPALQKPRPIKIPQQFFGRLRKTLDDFYGDGGGEVPTSLQNILNDVAENQTTTRTLTNVDRRLADFAGNAQINGNRAEAAFAQRIRADLGDAANKVAPKEYRDALATAKQIRADQGTRFETGDVASTFGEDQFRRPTVGNTTIPGRLLRPGAAGGDTADRLISAVGQDQAEQLARQEFRRVAEEAGISNEKQAATLQTKYAEAAKRFPQLEQDIATVRRHAAALDAARDSDLNSLQKAIQSTPLARISDASVDPSTFVSQLLNRQDSGRQLSHLYNQISDNEAAVAGYRRSLGDYIEGAKGPNVTASGDAIPSVNGTRKRISTVLSRAGDTLTSQQRIVLKMVGRELENANFANTAGKPAGSETAINETYKAILSASPIGAKAKFVYNLITDVLGNGKQVKDLISQAILDPDFAATLLKRPTERHWIQAQAALRSRDATAGIASTLHIPLPANDMGFLSHQPALAANPQDQGDNGRNGNAQQ